MSAVVIMRTGARYQLRVLIRVFTQPIKKYSPKLWIKPKLWLALYLTVPLPLHLLLSLIVGF